MFTEDLKLKYILKITIFFWILTKVISFKLWLSNRLFPVIPIIDLFDNCPNWLHLLLYFAGISLMVLVFFNSDKKILIGLTIFIEVTSCLLDQNRWQSYQYHFILIFCFIFFFRNSKNFINYFIFLLFIIYANSGLHKLNGGFLYYVWENLILKKFLGFENYQIQSTVIHYSGLLLGFLEFFFALGLLFSKHKKVFAALLILMHLFILILLSPIGIDHNYVVLPWNCAMILFLGVVYFTNENFSIDFKELVNGYQFILFVLIGILPLLNFFGLYDNYLSFNLYSGNLQKMFICIENKDEALVYKPYFFKSKQLNNCQNVISISNWSLREMNAFVYPEKRIYLKIMQKWKEKNPNVDATFYLADYPYHQENYIQLAESGVK